MTEIWNERLNRAATEQGSEFGEQLRNLDGHIARAENLLTMVTSNQQLLPTPLNEKLQSEPHAMMAIDKDGIIRGANDSAEALYGPLESKPISELPFDDSGLRAIRRTIAALTRSADAEPKPGLLQAFRTDDDSPVLISFAHWQTAGGRFLLLVKTVGFAWPDKLTPLVQDAFGLTPAETVVLKLLAEGQTVKSIAEIRGATDATVRTQVRAIYAKTSTRNQSEFLRMALGLTTMDLVDRQSVTGAFSVPDTIDESPFPRPENRHLLTLPGGRILDYAMYGAPDGKPVLFMHSEFFGDSMSAQAVRRAVEHNLLIIAPARPHNGRTSPYPDGVKTYDQVNADAVHLLDHLGVPEVVLFSQVMAPSLFTMMFAHKHPERVKAAVFLATLFPFGTKQEEAQLFSFHRYLSSIIHRTPSMLKFIAQAGMAYHNQVGSRRFFRTFAEKRPADLDTVNDDVAYAAMANGARLCGARGHEGYYNDYRCMPNDIGAKFMSLDMPIKAVIGDQLPEKSIFNLLYLIENKENYRSVSAPGSGQYVMFSNPILIMDTLAEMWAEAAATKI
ncbi:LuxR C-terminal-related transcriptional regulator [uncultured Erythrobacter sp.]|uniref:LuxR C-terminal-related transcriptional regulator n=1 Tax=uncultured Erythrobacter sp. TaxID=263913 RepID=UPI0026301555|nr:LuxR C-terminal-related transcriptional regulator [uncultured Erythrobacter sp.]